MLTKQVERELGELLKEFTSRFKRNQMDGAFDIALGVVVLVRKLVGNTTWSNAKELIESIKYLGKKLIESNSSEVIGNMIRRVLKLVREEYSGTTGNSLEGSSGASLQNILMVNMQSNDDYTIPKQGLKSVIIDAINELISELETSRNNIALKSTEYIHSNEIIMTFGKSRTVESFLKKASLKRKFSVIVAECAPFFHGQELAVSLASQGIETTVIPDSAVFAMMSRVNKVIIGAHAVYADGGLKACNGAQSMALAAKHHAVPFIVCTALFKLTPKFICNPDNLSEFSSPDLILDYHAQRKPSDYKAICPLFTYISADTVDLFCY